MGATQVTAFVPVEECAKLLAQQVPGLQAEVAKEGGDAFGSQPGDGAKTATGTRLSQAMLRQAAIARPVRNPRSNPNLNFDRTPQHNPGLSPELYALNPTSRSLTLRAPCLSSRLLAMRCCIHGAEHPQPKRFSTAGYLFLSMVILLGAVGLNCFALVR